MNHRMGVTRKCIIPQHSRVNPLHRKHIIKRCSCFVIPGQRLKAMKDKAVLFQKLDDRDGIGSIATESYSDMPDRSFHATQYLVKFGFACMKIIVNRQCQIKIVVLIKHFGLIL